MKPYADTNFFTRVYLSLPESEEAQPAPNAPQSLRPCSQNFGQPSKLTICALTPFLRKLFEKCIFMKVHPAGGKDIGVSET
jgi:hypothetical protein